MIEKILVGILIYFGVSIFFVAIFSWVCSHKPLPPEPLESFDILAKEEQWAITMTSLARFQQQLDRCLRKPMVKPEKPLTGIQKEAREQEEARTMWKELSE